MDEQGFTLFLKDAGRSEGTIKQYVSLIKAFEEFLLNHNKSLDAATPKDLQSFVDAGDPKKYRSFIFLSSIRNYYEFTGNDRMKFAFDELDNQRPQPYKLTDHPSVNPEDIQPLVALGIKTSRDLIEAGSAKKERESLSKQTGIPYDTILELVKLSDLSRKWGPKRVRLYFDAGYDTFDKVAAMDPTEFRKSIIDYVEKSGIKLTPPTPQEAHSAVEGAKRRPRIIEY
jgi:hypothetical protein